MANEASGTHVSGTEVSGTVERPEFAWGYGLATLDHDGSVLDTWFPSPALGGIPARRDRWLVPAELEDLTGEDPRRRVRVEPVTIEAELQRPPSSTSDAYLRLHLLSHLLVRPNTVNLDGIFGALPVVAWTNAGPVSPETLPGSRARLLDAGIHVTGLDRFPRLLDYVTPPGVRIADASRVRLGAYLSSGTTVMHEGFVNFNAGTLGAAMVEGRISQGVVVGADSDIGGGASIMGTLSGGGTQRVSIGRRALLGANSGVGIPLGDDCVVEAGLYVTAGTKVVVVGEVPSADAAPRTVKALDLAGMSGLLFRRNSLTGAVEVLSRGENDSPLNTALHA